MSAPMIDVTLWVDQEERSIGRCGLPLDVGRQSRDELSSELYQIQDHGNQFRLTVAPITALGLPRQTLRIAVDDQGKLEVFNPHSRSTFHVQGENDPVLPNTKTSGENQYTLALPEGLMLHCELVEDTPVRAMAPPPTAFRTIAVSVNRATQPVEKPVSDLTASLVSTFSQDSDVHRGRAAIDLVKQALEVVKKSAGSDEFFDAAVKSVAGMIELDQAYVLLREGDHWKPKAVYRRQTQQSEPHQTVPVDEQPLPPGSRSLLEKVLQQRQTVIYEPDSYQHTIRSSIMLLDRAVAAPIFDDNGKVVGALYGDRSYGSDQGNPAHNPVLSSQRTEAQNECFPGSPIGDLEAMLLEVMAGAVSAGWSRQRHEAIQTSMTQFFSPAVTQRLQQNEDLLSGRDAEVSVLFCDIRGFSRISERVGPKKTIQWINDVLTQLSECVMRTDGVLVDYIGDELMAMWGAPAEQPDHAKRACDAATEMLQQIDPLRQRWPEITPDHFGIGIGINTGIARVGNTGSRVKFKYGPLGNTVNLASRVQGMTKHFGVSAIITQGTVDALCSQMTAGETIRFTTRRLATVQPLGVSEILDLHQLGGGELPQWANQCRRYETALKQFEEADLTGAARSLASLVHENPDDIPSVVLLQRVVDAITSRLDKIDPVMRFQTK